MPSYEILVRCVFCPSEHPLHVKIYLEPGPDQKQSVADYFREGAKPPQLMAIEGHNALCLKTGAKFKIESDEQVLLVPTSLF